MRLHEKIAELRHKKGLTQQQMAEKIHMKKGSYGKLERGERQLKIPRLEKIAVALGIELKELLGVDEKIVFHASFHDHSGCQNENFYVNSAKEMAHELETSRLLLEQKEREMELLREQVGQLKEMVELMRK